MKRQAVTWILCTLFVLVTTGIYVWLTHSKDVATLSYVPDPNWSRRFTIKANLQDDTYMAGMDSQCNLHTVWINYDYLNQTTNLIHSVTHPKGNIRVKAHPVAVAAQIQTFSMAVTHDAIHLFWVGSQSTGYGDLNYTRLSLDGTVQERSRVLREEFDDARELQAVVSSAGGFLLAWSDQVEPWIQIKTFAFDPSNVDSTQKPTQLTTAPYDAYGPKLIADLKGRFHLTWKERSGRKQVGGILADRKYHCVERVVPILGGSAYSLMYQQLTARGEGVGESVFVDEVYLNTVAMAVLGDDVYLTWIKRIARENATTPTIIESSFPNYGIFGSKMSVSHPVSPSEVFQLSQQKGPAFDQGLVAEPNGALHLVYVDTYTEHLALTHTVFDGDFSTLQKKSRRIFPDQMVSLRTTLLSDPVGKLHLLWMQSDPYSGTLYYANTVHPRPVTPLNVVGINMDQSKVSLFMSLIFTLTLPIYSIFIYLHLFYITCITLIFTGCKYWTKKWRWNTLFSNPWIVIPMICIVHVLLYLGLDRADWLIWPTHPTGGGQIWFSVILATLTTVGYILFGDLKKNKMIQLGFVALLWLFWLQVSNLVFQLPLVNFVDRLG